MELVVLSGDSTTLKASYSCPCGCKPSLDYRRGKAIAEEGCCCGNHFAVGPTAGTSVAPRSGFRAEVQAFAAPWGEPLEAAWLVGPSTHDEHHHDGGHSHEEHHSGGQPAPGTAIDPVCGMTVDREAARASGMHSTHEGADYFFCSRGCKLDFDEEPERYVDPREAPSM